VTHRPLVSEEADEGEHWFEIEPVEGGTLLRHVIRGEAFGECEEIWRERGEPFRDRVIEALFDKIDATIHRDEASNLRRP
jgi:hypothetical protein